MSKENSAQNNQPSPVPPSHGVDKRYMPRWEVTQRILYRLEKETLYHEGQSKDISCDGLCLYADDDLAVNQKLTLTVYLSNDTAVYLEGKTIWNKTIDPSTLKESTRKFWIGIQLENTSSRVQELILEHAFNYKKEELLKHWYTGWEGS